MVLSFGQATALLNGRASTLALLVARNRRHRGLKENAESYDRSAGNQKRNPPGEPLMNQKNDADGKKERTVCKRSYQENHPGYLVRLCIQHQCQLRLEQVHLGSGYARQVVNSLGQQLCPIRGFPPQNVVLACIVHVDIP